MTGAKGRLLIVEDEPIAAGETRSGELIIDPAGEQALHLALVAPIIGNIEEQATQDHRQKAKGLTITKTVVLHIHRF